ncbi:MAG TPA: accessory Sec system translocase SecA2, partial [Arachnia sp.]|nr:accessory Sec system translocase SecA2 [Arachnia sp.]
MSALADRAREAIRRSGNERRLRGLGRVVDLASSVLPGPPSLDADSDEDLARYLATAGAAASSTLGMNPFRNQYLSAAAMLRGNSIELATGEGKTLVGALVAAGYALQGRDVHVLTANDYLAARDAAWMGPLYKALGVTCGVVTSASSPEERRGAYRQAVTYASVSEAGFDVLRDRLAADPSERTGARRDVVLLDEADAVLLDEARVPLVLAADGAAHVDEHADALADFARSLAPREHYEVAPDGRTVNLTDDGLRAVEAAFPGRDLFGADAEFLVSLNLALYAHAVLRRDVDYVVVGGRVWLVSGSRGRVERLQRWPDGLQLAVEAKERLDSATGLEVLDQLVVAELIEGYDRVVGMSATMLAAADELQQLYGIDVVAVPPHTPCIRDDRPTRLYLTGDDRDRALISLVAEARGASRPVLVACQSVRDSERYAELLRDARLPCVLLNAKNDREEAEVIAQAGTAGRITVSTQMAGRGTDIVLTPDAVVAGGLLVVGVGRFPSARLD